MGSVVRLRIALTVGERHLLHALREVAGPDAWAGPSVASLAEATGQSQSTIYRQLARLAMKQLVRKEKRRIVGRLRTGWVLLEERAARPAAPGQVLVIAEMRRIAAKQESELRSLRSEVAQLRDQVTSGPAANESVSEQLDRRELAGELIEQLHGAVVTFAHTAAGVRVFGTREQLVEGVSAGVLGPIEQQPLWPAHVPLGDSEFELARVARVFAVRSAPVVAEVLWWYRAHTLEHPTQEKWWGLQVFSEGAFGTAMSKAGETQALHEVRLAAILATPQAEDLQPAERPASRLITEDEAAAQAVVIDILTAARRFA